MAKIGFFILPPYKLKNKIIILKRNIEKQYGNQIYLNHIPHLTLFTLEIDKLKLLKDKIYNFQSNYYNNRKIKIKTNKIEYFLNDPLTNGNTQYISINKNNKLNELQLYLINNFKNLQAIKKRKKNNFKNTLLNKNFIKFGYPYIGKIWIPHFTICSFNKKYNINEIISNNKKYKIKQSFEVNKVSIFKISKNKHPYYTNIKL